jgi:PAS domain S-box-containing protein
MLHNLKALERRWGMALQSAAFGVWDLDLRGQTVHYSPEWKAMLGYGAADEADSTATWRDRVHPDDLGPMLDALNAHQDGQTSSYEMEFRLRAANGSYRWVLSRGRVVSRDEQGGALRMVGTLTDLTDRREMELMHIARDRAEAANLAKTQFLSRMSHELRTPLNAVLGFAQLLSRRIGDADLGEQRRYVAQIEKAGWHLLAMINDVLDLSRVESGQLAIEIAPVPLAALCHSAGEMMVPMAREHGVEIRTASLPPHATVLADPLRLNQVLTNLLSNAIKYNRAGGSVTLELTPVQDRWCLSVSDTGLGIPQAQIPHLFEPFNRLGRAASAVEGVGIGLALSRWLVEKMGGTIAARSIPDCGTTFEVSLPDADRAARPRGAENA